MKYANLNYVILGAIISLLLGTTAMAITTSEMLLINTNPTGATVTVSGQNLGTTPYYINPRVYPSPTFLRLTKSGYVSVNAAMYQWMVPPVYKSVTYTMRSSSGTTQPADNPPSVSASHSPASPTTSDNVIITASASDDKGLSQITVYADNAAKVTCSVSGTSTSCPYGSTFSAGTHSYYATAKDTAGKTATSTTKQFTVSVPAPTPSKLLTLNSNPQGADAWINDGPYNGKYLGKTPFPFDITADSAGRMPACGGNVACWMIFKKSGYMDAQGVVYSGYNIYGINLNPLR